MTTPTSQILSELADREAIRECLYRYSRGVDRLDADMLRTAYWPDCIDDHMGFVGNVYFCEPQRFGKIRASGEVVTLAGYRHRTPPTHWNDATQNVELVGDWSNIRADRRYFRKLWGLAWNSS